MHAVRILTAITLSLALGACVGSSTQTGNPDTAGDPGGSGDPGGGGDPGGDDDPAETYTIGGTARGVDGGGLVLQLNGAGDLTVEEDGPFTFADELATGATYAVTVKTPPPGLVCDVIDGDGTIQETDITDVQVKCRLETESVGGTVSGLIDSMVVLALNGADALEVTANGEFVFPVGVASGATYEVTVIENPAGQTCAVTQGSGTMAGGPVMDVLVACAPNLYEVGGTVTGLVSGSLTLQLDGGADLTLSSDGSFAFASAVPYGSAYTVTVLQQPEGHKCMVVDGSATMGPADVTSVSVSCSLNSYAVGGTVAGLVSGSLSLQLDGAGELIVTENGSFVLPEEVLYGATYTVTLVAQPVGHTCVVGNDTGTMGAAAVTDVTVECTLISYFIGYSVTGLFGGGHLGVKVNDVGGAVTQDGNYIAKSLTFGSSYVVEIFSQPTGLVCSPTSTEGTMDAHDTFVPITCVAKQYAVGGTLSGLTSGNLVLRLNDGADLTLGSNGAFTFTNTVAYKSSYAVAIVTQPAEHRCSVSSGSGTMGAANVTSVAVTCVPSNFIGGTVTGLTGSGLVLKLNDGPSLPVDANGPFTFTNRLYDDEVYRVTIEASPSGLECAAPAFFGTVAGDVTDIAVTCGPAKTWKTSTYIGDTYYGHNMDPVVAFAGDTTVVAYLRGGGPYNLLARHRTSTGWSTPVLLEEATETASAPQMAGIAGGEAIAIWAQKDGTSHRLWANRFDGSSWSGRVAINSDDVPLEEYTIAMNGAGEAMAVWTRKYADGNRRLFAARYVPGTGWRPSSVIDIGGADIDATRPNIAFAGTGEVFVSWQGATAAWVNVQRADESWVGRTQLAANTYSSPWVAAAPSGEAIAVWRHYDDVTWDSKVWYRHYSPASGWGVAARLDPANNDSQSEPVVAMSARGQAFVAWRRSNSSSTRPMGRSYIPGVGWSEVELLAGRSPGHYASGASIRMAVNDAGHAIVYWTDSDLGTSRYLPGVGWLGYSAADTVSQSVTLGDIVINPAGIAEAVWEAWVTYYNTGVGRLE